MTVQVAQTLINMYCKFKKKSFYVKLFCKFSCQCKNIVNCIFLYHTSLLFFFCIVYKKHFILIFQIKIKWIIFLFEWLVILFSRTFPLMMLFIVNVSLVECNEVHHRSEVLVLHLNVSILCKFIVLLH